MSYYTENELCGFNFQESYIAEMKQMSSHFYAILDNVTILSTNSTNRDIRDMRANELTFKITNGQITSLVEEGYKVYDADGNLTSSVEDNIIATSEYNNILDSLSGCTIYSIVKNEQDYIISIDTEDHTFLIKISGNGDSEEWDRYLANVQS